MRGDKRRHKKVEIRKEENKSKRDKRPLVMARGKKEGKKRGKEIKRRRIKEKSDPGRCTKVALFDERSALTDSLTDAILTLPDLAPLYMG